MYTKLRKHIFILSLLCMATSTSYAFSLQGSYINASLGVLQGNYNVIYRDRTDVIPQNIAESIQQNGYDAGIAIGYTIRLCNCYLAVEFAGHYDTNRARFQSGAATAAFRDTVRLQYYFDGFIVPGYYLAEGLLGYFKIGVSAAHVANRLRTPVGFTPEFVTEHNNRNLFGFAAGLGVKKTLTPCLAVLAEYTYHDYGHATFDHFVNFTAEYSHRVHLATNIVALGLEYRF